MVVDTCVIVSVSYSKLRRIVSASQEDRRWGKVIHSYKLDTL